MSHRDVVRELAEVKEHALKASRDNDREFYAGYLADDAVAILPQGVFSKTDVLRSMAGDRAPFSAKRIEGTRITALGPDTGMVTYTAIYERNGEEHPVAATTIYRRQRGRWQGIFYQQTGLPPH